MESRDRLDMEQKKQHNEELQTLKELNEQEIKLRDNKIKDLEQVLAKKNKQEQIIALDRSFQKENLELQQLIEKMKKERSREQEKWNKEKEQLTD